jgi:hypothetical protein
MYKVGPLKRGYWQVEFTNNGMVTTELVNGPGVSNDWIRLWCDSCFLEGTDWSNLRIIVNPPNEWLTLEPYQEPKCECGSDKAGSPAHSHWCPKHEADYL